MKMLFSVLLYVAKAWALTEAYSIRNVVTPENSKIPWTAGNHENKKVVFWFIMKNANRYGLLQQIFESKVLGEESTQMGAPWLKNFRNWFLVRC